MLTTTSCKRPRANTAAGSFNINATTPSTNVHHRWPVTIHQAGKGLAKVLIPPLVAECPAVACQTQSLAPILTPHSRQQPSSSTGYPRAMATTQEMQDLKAAITASLQSEQKIEPQFSDPGGHRLDSEPIAKFIQDSLPASHQLLMTSKEYLELRRIDVVNTHCAGLQLSEGDTIVFVDFPAARNSCRPPLACDGLPFHSHELRLHSEKLLATKSPIFEEMLRPSYQIRAQRRRKLTGKLPDGVKYVLDLTPAPEGEEMAFQMTELSLPPGIIKWWSSYARLNVPFFLVKGHDDVCPCKGFASSRIVTPALKPVLAQTGQDNEDAAKPVVAQLPLTVSELVSARNNNCKLQIENIPEHFDIPDYCPIRHRNGIIRLLMLVEGKQVLLDSAARVWTLVALAKIWNCGMVVQDHVTQWLLHNGNSQFIEVLPEEALRIGGVIESAPVTMAAFQILVGELALEEAADPALKQGIDYRHLTIFGRRKGYAGDEMSNLVQHAARALIERTKARVAMLQPANLLDHWGLSAWQKLLKLENALKEEESVHCLAALKCISQLKDKLRSGLEKAIKRRVTPHQVSSCEDFDVIDAGRAKYIEPPDFHCFVDIYKSLNETQRMLTWLPYKQLEKAWIVWTEQSRTKSLDPKDSSAADLERDLRLELAVLYHTCGPWQPDSWYDAFGFERRDLPQDMRPCDVPVGLIRLETEVSRKIREMGLTEISESHELPTRITRHMWLMLTNNETKYLPLWAGGCNDGSGGVFEDQIPPADMGPSGPGPAYHTGTTLLSDASSLSGSFLDDMSAMDIAGSTTAASIDVHDSISTVHSPDHVIADDKSIASESFRSELGDFQEARRMADSPEGGQMEWVPESLDDSLLYSDSDEDSTLTICGDDALGSLEDELEGLDEKDVDVSGQLSSAVKIIPEEEDLIIV